MSTVTTRLGLTKPAGIEQFNLATYNNNLDLVDGFAITEEAERKKIRLAEYTGPVVVSPAGNGVNFGQMTIDAAHVFNNTFVTPNGVTGLKILETGMYELVHMTFPDANPGTTHLWATRTGHVSDNIISANFTGYGNSSSNVSIPFYAVANDVIQCGMTSSNTVNTGSRIKIIKTQG